MNGVTDYGRLLYSVYGKPWAKAAPATLRRRMLDAAIEVYHPDACWDGGKAWRKRLVERLREEDGYGNPLLIIILVPLAQLLIKYLIEWLLERRENRDLMAEWHRASQG